jgi:hypothetical protein
MKKLFLVLIFLASLNFAAQAQRSGDIVTINLKNGVITEGKIVELKKGDYVKLKQNDGQIFTYYWYEINSFNNEPKVNDVKPSTNTNTVATEKTVKTTNTTANDNSQNQYNINSEPDFENEKSKMRIGIQLNLGTYTNVGVGINLKIPLSTEGLYLVPSFNYLGSKTTTESFSFFSISESYYSWSEVNIDVQYDVTSKKDVAIYVLSGLSLGFEYIENISGPFGYSEVSNTGVGLNLGGGIDLLKSKKINPFIEANYNTFFSQILFSVGMRF